MAATNKKAGLDCRVWLLYHPKHGWWFSPPANSPEIVWKNARMWEELQGYAHPNPIAWEEEMKRRGWRAKRTDLQPVIRHGKHV